MKVAVVGVGYVGLVAAACLADGGNHMFGLSNPWRGGFRSWGCRYFGQTGHDFGTSGCVYDGPFRRNCGFCHDQSRTAGVDNASYCRRHCGMEPVFRNIDRHQNPDNYIVDMGTVPPVGGRYCYGTLQRDDRTHAL